jgi:amino acid adenylation domain-containing protein
MTIPELFAAQVAARPGAVAVSAGATRLSYSDLDERAGRVASWLRGRAAGPDAVVALQMRRGPELIVALLGVLKAGAAYLALDPDAPRQWRERLITEARPVALIGDDARAPATGLPTLRLPTDFARADGAAEVRGPTAFPDSLAYVCFTSGSTGRPKGVAVTHRAVTRLAEGDHVELGPGHTFLHLSPLSFDASTFEIFAALLTGARLAVFPPGPLVAEDLVRVLAEEEVTTLWLTAGLLHRMADHHLAAFGGLRQLVAGGDVLSPAHIKRVVDRFPGLRLVNGYGPTENTTFTSCHTVSRSIRAESVPIGRPISGTGIRILDDRLRPVPPGAWGELYVTGAGLARGYLAQPALTAAGFLADPFAAQPGARMYRTGDLVRLLPSGELEFVGRRDRQVKVNGFRVEPFAVEREIIRQAGVGEAVVLPRPGPGGQRLVAYLVAEQAGAVEETTVDEVGDDLVACVRRGLRDTLPAHMVPSLFVTLPELPLTPGGKVDTAALPVPAVARRQADSEYLPPRTPTEQMLCDIWAEHIGLDLVGAADDFFELGGNSLLAMDLIRRAELVFGVELPVRMLLYHPTVAQFARAVDSMQAGRQVSE